MDYGIGIEDAGYAGIIPGTTGAADPFSAHPTAGESGIASGTGSGQHGFTLIGGGSMSDALSRVWAWLNRPFSTPMSPVDIGLLIGVILIAILFWNLLLYHIRIAAESI
jgi:hypothetical protein